MAYPRDRGPLAGGADPDRPPVISIRATASRSVFFNLRKVSEKNECEYRLSLLAPATVHGYGFFYIMLTFYTLPLFLISSSRFSPPVVHWSYRIR